MRPLAVGVAAAIILAGPPLYSLVQAGSLTGSTALFRGLVVMVVCTAAATFLDGIVSDFQKDVKHKTEGKIVHHPSSDGPGGPGGSGGGTQAGQVALRMKRTVVFGRTGRSTSRSSIW